MRHFSMSQEVSRGLLGLPCTRGGPQGRVSTAWDVRSRTTCRKRRDAIETRLQSLAWDESRGWFAFCLNDGRHKDGVSPAQALVWNVGTCTSTGKSKGAGRLLSGARTEQLNAPHFLGLSCGSNKLRDVVGGGANWDAYGHPVMKGHLHHGDVAGRMP